MRDKKRLDVLVELLKKKTRFNQQMISKKAGYDPNTLASARSRPDGQRPVIEHLELVFADVLKGSMWEKMKDAPPEILNVVDATLASHSKKADEEDWHMKYTQLLEKYVHLNEQVSEIKFLLTNANFVPAELMEKIHTNSGSILKGLELMFLRLKKFQEVALVALARQAKMKNEYALVEEMGKMIEEDLDQREQDTTSARHRTHSF